MKTYAKLGDFEFAGLKGFSAYSRTGAALYAEHQLLEGKARLQKTGTALDEINISIRLHVSFCKPDEELNILKSYRDEGEVLVLQYGNGKIVGSFVIVSIEETVEEADAEGNIFSYLVSFNLKEYVTNNKLHQLQSVYRDSAKAVGDIKPVALIKVQPVSCPVIISKQVLKLESITSFIVKILIEKGGIGFPQNRYQVINSLKSLKEVAADLIYRTEDPQSCVHGNNEVKQTAQEILDSSNNLISLVEQNAILQVLTQIPIFQRLIGKMKVIAKAYVNRAILRK